VHYALTMVQRIHQSSIYKHQLNHYVMLSKVLVLIKWH